MTTFTVWLKSDKDLDEKFFCGWFRTEQEAQAHLESLRPSLYPWEELMVAQSKADELENENQR